MIRPTPESDAAVPADVAVSLSGPPEPTAAPTRVRYVVLGVVCSLAVLTYIQRLGFGAALGAIEKDLGLSSAQVGDLGFAFLLAYGLFQVPGGLLGDRVGGRHLLTALVLGWSILTAAVVLVVFLRGQGLRAFYFLLATRFLFGMFQAGGFPTLARVIADWVPYQARASAQGTVWMFSRIGGMLTPFLFLGLVKLFGNWKTPLFLIGGLGVVWCAGFWPWFRNRPQQMRRVNAAERALIASGRPAEAAATGRFPLMRMLTSPSVWGLCLMYGLGGFAGNFFTFWEPVYLEKHRGLTGTAANSLWGLTLGLGLLGCVLGGIVSDLLIQQLGSRKWGRRLNGLVGLALAGLVWLSALWIGDGVLLGLLFSVGFFMNDCAMGPAWAACADIGERHAGTVSGAMNMTGAFAGAVGMSLAGRFFEAHRDNTMFVIFACSYGLASLCWLAVDVTKPLEAKE